MTSFLAGDEKVENFHNHTEELKVIPPGSRPLRPAPTSSRTSALPLGPIGTREEAEVLIDQAVEALANAAGGIATLIEDLQGRHSLIQRRISSLRRVATQLEKGTWKPPQCCQSESEPTQVEVDLTQSEVAPVGSAVAPLAALVLLLRGLE